MAFYWTNGISRLPEIDLTGVTASDGFYATFLSCNELVTIDNLIFPESGEHPVLTSMFGCPKLKNIKITGHIGQTVDFTASTQLSRASIESIMTHLSDTATGKTVTLNKIAVNKAFETADGANDGSVSNDWEWWTGTKQKWDISLV
jgi:hypothetical protein